MIILIDIWENDCLSFCDGAGLSWKIDGDVVILRMGHDCLRFCIGASLSRLIDGGMIILINVQGHG